MKFSTVFFTLSLALGAFSEPIPQQKRSLAQYTDVIQGISDQVTVLSGDVTDYVAGSVAGTVVQDASDELVTIINDGVTAVNGFAALGNLDALGLVTPIQDLSDQVSDLIDQIIAAKPQFTADNLAGDVLANLQEQKTASEALATAITAKVPAALQDIAAELAAQISANIQRGIDAYSA